MVFERDREYEWEPSMDPDFELYDELLALDGVTERKADQLSEQYANLPTLSWATWHDEAYIQDEVQINPDFLRDQLWAADLYESYHHFPDCVIRPDRPETTPQSTIPATTPRPTTG